MDIEPAIFNYAYEENIHGSAINAEFHMGIFAL